MEHIQSETVSVHPSGQTIFKIKISCRCTQYSQRTKPAISGKQERTVDRRVSDVFAKICYAEEDTQNC